MNTSEENLKKSIIGFYGTSIKAGNIKFFEPIPFTVGEQEFEVNSLIESISYDSLTKSPFGYKKHAVYDDNMRKCMEYKYTAPQLALQILGQRVVDSFYSGYIVEVNKFLVYDTNGHFNTHIDTPEKHLEKSLVLILKTQCAGGELEFVDINQMMLVDPDFVNYCLFDINERHRVNTVTSGRRIIIHFKVYNSSYNKIFPSMELCQKDVIFEEQSLIAALRNLRGDNILISVRNADAFLEYCRNINICAQIVYGELDYCIRDKDFVYSKFIADNMSDYNSYTLSNMAGIDDTIMRYVPQQYINCDECDMRTYVYNRYVGDSGNSAILSENEMSYMTFVLLNPVPYQSMSIDDRSNSSHHHSDTDADNNTDDAHKRNDHSTAHDKYDACINICSGDTTNTADEHSYRPDPNESFVTDSTNMSNNAMFNQNIISTNNSLIDKAANTTTNTTTTTITTIASMVNHHRKRNCSAQLCTETRNKCTKPTLTNANKQCNETFLDDQLVNTIRGIPVCSNMAHCSPTNVCNICKTHKMDMAIDDDDGEQIIASKKFEVFDETAVFNFSFNNSGNSDIVAIDVTPNENVSNPSESVASKSLDNCTITTKTGWKYSQSIFLNL